MEEADDWYPLTEDEAWDPCCHFCGKPMYDWSDLGCSICDVRHPEFGGGFYTE